MAIVVLAFGRAPCSSGTSCRVATPSMMHLNCGVGRRLLRVHWTAWVRGFGAGQGVLSAPPPHPTRLCPWCRPRLPSSRLRTSWHGSSGRISWAVWHDGWRLPTAGPLACPLPPAAGPGTRIHPSDQQTNTDLSVISTVEDVVSQMMK